MRRADDEEECKYLIKAEEEEEQAGDDSTDLLIDTQPRTMKPSNNPISSAVIVSSFTIVPLGLMIAMMFY